MLAETLREARRKKGWSILHLSKRSGVSWWVIRRIEDESPSYVPSEGNVALLAEALRMPVGILLAERGRLVERLRHRPYEAAEEYRGVST
jgi:transcriptional regulator with XRE-family HTH domain